MSTALPGRCTLLCAALLPLAAAAQSTDEMNASNNPLTPSIGANVQDSYVGRYYGLGDEDSNALLLRGTLPHKLFGQPQLLRATLPVLTTPDLPPDGRKTNVGDLNLFDLFLFRVGHVEVGIGPQLTLPTAGDDATGSGKWQAGLAGTVIAPQRWGLAGGLVTWQQSFAGDDDREDLDTLQIQPFLIYNLPQAWYLRSTATWNYDLRGGDYYLPLGLGLGKIWKDGKTTFNLFAEPQWTVAHDGDGAPKFQVFFGLNMQFPL
jgi:hypothetical protein